MVIFLSWLTALLISAFIYPNHFITVNRKFLNTPDAGIPFVNTYALVNQFFHGGIQLFDRNDQINYVYSHMSAGVYTLDNVVTAIFYAIASPFFQYPAEAYHHVFCVFYYGFIALIRTVGGYLLLTLFIKNKFIMFISLVYLNTFLASQTMIDGHISQSLYCFLPLLLFFVLRFFQEWRLNDFLAAVLMMVIGIASSPLFGLGYFYLIVHFFILLCLGYAVAVPDVRRRMINAFRWPGRPQLLKIGGAIALSVLILLPVLLMVPTLKQDFYVADSGLGQTSGRINNAFKPMNYFKIEGKSFANPLEFFFRSVDFEHYVWPRASWVFLGMSIFGFSLLAIVLARDPKKHLFWLLILCIILMNVATYPHNIIALYLYIKGIFLQPLAAMKQGFHLDQLPAMILLSCSGIVHWINVLTNPFSFLLRSFHVPTMFMPYLFLPLIALGMSVCTDLIRGREERIHRARIPGLMIGLLVVLVICLVYTSGIIRVYTACGVGTFLIVLALAWWGRGGRLNAWRVGAFLGALIAADILALHAYAKDGLKSTTMVAERFDGLPEGRSLIFGYQNPKLLAFREYMRPWPVALDMTSIENYYGLFYQYTPMHRYFDTPSIYSPVPMAYRDLHHDAWGKIYLGRERRLISWRDMGISSEDAQLSDMLTSNAEQRVLLVNDPAAPGLVKPGAVRLEPRSPPQQWSNFTFAVREARVRTIGTIKEYAFKLPAGFPRHIATGTITEDYNSLQLRLGNRDLMPAQGKLTEPFSFDVQNVRDGWLTVLLPAGEAVEAEIFDLRMKMPAYINDIWRNEHDRFGFTMQVPRDGWMIVHYPYDAKWQLTIDGKPAKLYRVNNYFMGAPVQQGERRILLNYWPDTPLRGLLILSMLLTALACEGLVLYAFWRHRPGRNETAG